jgi:hypothetical protein
LTSIDHLGSIDRDGLNRLKPPVKTGSGFNRPTLTKPLSWLLFIDDIEMKWVDGRESLNDFIDMENSFHNSIKFTVDISIFKNTILDTTATLTNKEIEFNLHTKPTDSHLYLMPSSCHPPHTFKRVPKGLAIRIRRICFSPTSFQEQGNILKKHLTNRG